MSFFFSPWALWQDETVKAIDLPYTQLHHEVIVISHLEKHVPSSEAHRRVKTQVIIKAVANGHLKI